MHACVQVYASNHMTDWHCYVNEKQGKQKQLRTARRWTCVRQRVVLLFVANAVIRVI